VGSLNLPSPAPDEHPADNPDVQQIRRSEKRLHSTSSSPAAGSIKRRKLDLPEEEEQTEEERKIALFSPKRSRSSHSESVSPQKNATNTNGHLAKAMEQPKAVVQGVNKFEPNEQQQEGEEEEEEVEEPQPPPQGNGANIGLYLIIQFI